MHPKPEPLTPSEYLAQELARTVKCEFVSGEVHAMAGASRQHNLIVSTLIYHARAAAPQACSVFGPDMKVYVPAHNSFYYPDLSVSCDAEDRHELYIERPCFIIEVASPSTIGIDRREKRVSYTSIASLMEYAVVHQNRFRVELYRRRSSRWQGFVLSQPNDLVESSCLQMALSLEQIYEGVTLPSRVGEPDEPVYAELGL